MPTPMSAFDRVAAAYGDVNPEDDSQVDQFFEEIVSSMPKATAEKVFEDLLAAQSTTDGFRPRRYQAPVPLPRLIDSLPRAQTNPPSRHLALRERQDHFLAELREELQFRISAHRCQRECLWDDAFQLALHLALTRAATSEDPRYTAMLAASLASLVDPTQRATLVPHLVIKTVSDCSLEHLLLLQAMPERTFRWEVFAEEVARITNIPVQMAQGLVSQLERMGLIGVDGHEVGISQFGSAIMRACKPLR